MLKNRKNYFLSVNSLVGEVNNILVTERDENRAFMKANPNSCVAYLTRAAQYKRLSLLVKSNLKFKTVYSQVLQNVADKIEKSTQAWMNHVRKGLTGKKSPPKLREPKDYLSFTFPQYDSAAHIKKGRLHLSKIGEFKVNDGRKLKGKTKSLTVKFKKGQWWVSSSLIKGINLQPQGEVKVGSLQRAKASETSMSCEPVVPVGAEKSGAKATFLAETSGIVTMEHYRWVLPGEANNVLTSNLSDLSDSMTCFPDNRVGFEVGIPVLQGG